MDEKPIEQNSNSGNLAWMKEEFPAGDDKPASNNDEQPENKPKRKFLTRGAGTAGGGKAIGKTPSKNQRSPIRGSNQPATQDFRDEMNPTNMNSIDDFKNLEASVKE